MNDCVYVWCPTNIKVINIETKFQLRVLSDRLEEPQIKLQNPAYKMNGWSTTPSMLFWNWTCYNTIKECSKHITSWRPCITVENLPQTICQIVSPIYPGKVHKLHNKTDTNITAGAWHIIGLQCEKTWCYCMQKQHPGQPDHYMCICLFVFLF